MYLVPNPGRTVIDPDRSDLLPAEGRNVEPTQYWLRRLSDGDVSEAERPAEPIKPAAPTPASA